jgi:hypothetical protein
MRDPRDRDNDRNLESASVVAALRNGKPGSSGRELPPSNLRGTADYVKFHEVRRTANTHRGAGDDADDVAVAH